MRWMVAMLAVLTVQDGGTSDVPLFHEPMTRPVPLKRPAWRYPPELLGRRVSGLDTSCTPQVIRSGTGSSRYG